MHVYESVTIQNQMSPSHTVFVLPGAWHVQHFQHGSICQSIFVINF